MAYLIAVELGTTRAKTAAYDLEGNLVFEMAAPYPLYFEKESGRAESNPEDWWEAIKNSLLDLTQNIPSPKEIKAISIGSHGPSLVAVDKNGKPVYNSILWLDKRSKAETRLLSQKINRNVNVSLIPKAMWLKKHKPDSFKNVKYIFQPLDYINFKLTNNISASIATEFIKPWDEDSISASGLSANLFPKFLKMGEVIGYTSKEACLETGLKQNIPVISSTGGADFVEVYISCGITEEGAICDRGGTSQGVNICWPKKLNNKSFFVAPHPLIKDYYHISGLMSTTGKALQWYKELAYGKNTSYNRFFEDAESSKPGANNLIFLPYLAGERTPWWDYYARGVFFGLSLEHTEKDIARAILEGIGFGINQIIQLFKEEGANPIEIKSCGGQSRSPLWNQIKADITGLPVKTTYPTDNATLGLAIIAGYGIGVYDDIVKTSDKLIKIDRIYKPNSKNYYMYSQMQKIYNNLYPSLKKEYHNLQKISSPT